MTEEKAGDWEHVDGSTRGISFVTANLFAQSLWGCCEGRQWKTLYVAYKGNEIK